MKKVKMIGMIILILVVLSGSCTAEQVLSVDTQQIYSFITSVFYSTDSIYINQRIALGIDTSIENFTNPLTRKEYNIVLHEITMSTDSSFKAMVYLSSDTTTTAPQIIALLDIQKNKDSYFISKAKWYVEGEWFGEILSSFINNITVPVSSNEAPATTSKPVMPNP